MERVSIREGERPIMLIAPHGADDTNTDLLAEYMAEDLDAYAVINRGWERASRVNYFKDKANCNDITHIHEDVVNDEFLQPILRFVSKLEREYDSMLVLILHGMSNFIVNKNKGEPVDVVVGYGAGKPNSLSCEMIVKDAICYHMRKSGLYVYEGAAGGQYAGRMKNNLNQLFRKWYLKPNVHSVQLEVVRDLRDDNDTTKYTADHMADCVNRFLDMDFTEELPKDWHDVLQAIGEI
jgi:hypothetical protein